VAVSGAFAERTVAANERCVDAYAVGGALGDPVEASGGEDDLEARGYRLAEGPVSLVSERRMALLRRVPSSSRAMSLKMCGRDYSCSTRRGF